MTTEQRYAFFKACFILREHYIENLQEHCYCMRFEGPEIPNGKYLNCELCKASVEFNFFDLQSMKDDISALRRLYKTCEKINFRLLMDNVRPFSLVYKKEKTDVLLSLLNYVFVLRSRIISSSEDKYLALSHEALNLNCYCPICSFRKQWNMFDLDSDKSNLQRLSELFDACVKTCFDLMMYGIEPYWFRHLETTVLGQSIEQNNMFYFRL